VIAAGCAVYACGCSESSSPTSPTEGAFVSRADFVPGTSAVRVERYALVPMPPMAVGGEAQLLSMVGFHDGSKRQGLYFTQLSCSHPSVLDVQPNGWMRGLSPGLATVTASYYGAVTTLQVRVE